MHTKRRRERRRDLKRYGKTNLWEANEMKKNLREREANETFMINKFTIKKKNLARHERQ